MRWVGQQNCFTNNGNEGSNGYLISQFTGEETKNPKGPSCPELWPMVRSTAEKSARIGASLLTALRTFPPKLIQSGQDHGCSWVRERRPWKILMRHVLRQTGPQFLQCPGSATGKVYTTATARTVRVRDTRVSLGQELSDAKEDFSSGQMICHSSYFTFSFFLSFFHGGG